MEDNLPKELLICGSGASEAIPALFCDCEICRQAWKNKGKDIRSRTAYQLGSGIRIDFGPDALLHRFRYDLHYEDLRHLFITHPHRDHFSPLEMNYHVHGPMGPAMLKEHTLTLYGTQPVIDQFQAGLVRDFSKMRLKLETLDPVRDTRVLENGIRVTGIRANHVPGALNYIFEMPSGFTFFIGTDSGKFKEETWAVLREFHFDLMILDAAAGLLDINGGHCTAKQVRDIAARLRDEKIVDDATQLVTNHFAHCGGMLHKDLEEFYRPLGIEPGYDGMIVKLSRS